MEKSVARLSKSEVYFSFRQRIFPQMSFRENGGVGAGGAVRPLEKGEVRRSETWRRKRKVKVGNWEMRKAKFGKRNSETLTADGRAWRGRPVFRGWRALSS